MAIDETPSTHARRKAATGIVGFDTMTGGGLPRGRTTLVQGGAGCGKTVMALQTLVNGARTYGEPGIFVAFEESPERIIANAELFGWDVAALHPDSLYLLDAQPKFDMVVDGSFDIGGMLAMITARADAIGARRIVFDALDVIMTLLDETSARREVYRLHEWLLERGMTALITHKLVPDAVQQGAAQRLDFLQFMVDCVVTLDHEVVQGTSQRHLRIVKYRGSAFDEDEAPVVISDGGIEVAATDHDFELREDAPEERVSSGIERLDTMLGGGYYRGAGVLITGAPGTSKTTLCGAFIEAACRRGEPTLFMSFDSRSGELIRNLASVQINLAPFVDQGLLKILGVRAISGNAETHLMRIKRMALAQGTRCLVIDPISALAKTGDVVSAHNVVERLIDWAKSEDITVLCTSLLSHANPQFEGTAMQISTIADTWIHLNYLVHAGERNRGLSIVKSRGTHHSNQVRELVLSDTGVTLADVYIAGGEVLMGTLRWEKERQERLQRATTDVEELRRKQKLAAETAQIEAQIQILQRELEIKQNEQASMRFMTERKADERADSRDELLELRRADTPDDQARDDHE